ncbi:MAG: hypothetical protein ABI628_06140 [Chloroflexota bacterium]
MTTIAPDDFTQLHLSTRENVSTEGWSRITEVADPEAHPLRS